jgi:hypothetical protein
MNMDNLCHLTKIARRNQGKAVSDMPSTKPSQLPVAYFIHLSKDSGIVVSDIHKQSCESGLGRSKKLLSGPKTGTFKCPPVTASEWCFRSDKALTQGWYMLI